MSEYTNYVADRRTRTLTKLDLEDLAQLMEQHNICALGINAESAKMLNQITPEQWGICYRIITMLGRAANIAGGVIVATIVAALIAFFTKSFWLSFAGAIKKAGQ